MAATNVQYASGFTNLEALVLHTLPDFGKMGEGVLNNNFLFAALNEKQKMKRVTDGGLEIWKGIIDSESTNFKFQSHLDSMTANLQDPAKRLRYEWKTFTGSVVLNELDKAMNKGRAMIKNYARTLREQAELTVPNQFNSAFWITTPGTNEPNSIPSLFPTANTTGTIGGINRSTGIPFQHGVYATTVTDIGSESGLKALKAQIIARSVGSGGRDSVDIVIMGDDNYAALQAYLDERRQYRTNDTLAKMGFDTLQMGKTTISYENALSNFGSPNTIGASDVYGLNSNHLFLEVLRDGNFIWDPEGFHRVAQSMNRALYFWVFCNLVTNLPRAFFKMTDVSNA